MDLDRTPAVIADAAAEEIRALNHITRSRGDGWQYPGDVYSTVGNLSVMAERLPQALGQLESLISRLEDAGQLASDSGPEDLPGRLVRFHGAMADAVSLAHGLQRALDQAHQALGPIAYKE